MKNRIKKRTVALAIIIHLYVALFSFGISLLLLMIVGVLTSVLLEKDIKEASSSSNSFNKNMPFRYFGQVFRSFKHVFYHSFSIEKNIYDAIESDLKDKTPIS